MPHFASKRPRLRGVVMIAAIALIGFAGASSARADRPSVAAPVTPSVVRSPAGRSAIQLADEIVRRLRRLGINFNKSRLDRPYDGEGEIC